MQNLAPCVIDGCGIVAKRVIHKSALNKTLKHILRILGKWRIFFRVGTETLTDGNVFYIQ